MKLSKNTLDYWRERLQKRKFSRPDGSTYENPHYFVWISINGKQVRFTLDSGNKEVAADKALEIWHHLKANGTTATLEKYKPAKTQPKSDPTVGEFLEEVKNLRLFNPRTCNTYSRKFRRIVVGAMKIPSPKSKCDYVNGGYQKWLARVESVKISHITPVKILQWRASYLKKASQDPVSQRKAHVTVTSTIRNAKALFKADCLKLLPFKNLHNPFAEIKAGSSTTRRYKSDVDFSTLITDATKELYSSLIPPLDPSNLRASSLAQSEALSKREQYKILILGLGAGLRRGEIDTLLWSKIDFSCHQITVEESQYGGVKTESSERIVDIHESLSTLLAEFKKKSESKFVVESTVLPRPHALYCHYRCDRHFKGLIKWLRTKGVTRSDPIHTLRKEFGSKMCESFGIHAASEALGHKSIGITKASYLEKKGRKVVSVF